MKFPVRDSLIARWLQFACIGLLLLWTYRLFDFSYFWIDDFSNLYWVQQSSLADMLWALFNPLSGFFRPVGMMCYWVLLRSFDLNAAPYHWFAWSLHAGNTFLVYSILKRLTQSNPGATVGAMLFSSQAVFADIYWSFGTIFELLAALLMFLGILAWMSESRGFLQLILVTVLFFFALKAKEMAITLPAIWLIYDLVMREKSAWRWTACLIVPGSLGLWYGLGKAAEMGSTTNRDHPYYMDLTSLALGRGFGGYFSMLFRMELRWQLWAIAFAGVFLLFVILRNRRAVFFQSYLFVTFLPIIFLVNHRDPFYWYIPFLGVCGLAAVLTNGLVGMAEHILSAREAAVYGTALFALLCVATYVVQRNGSKERRALQQKMARDYRNFTTGLRSIPPPAQNATFFYESVPPYFDANVSLYATQVALRRTDVSAKVGGEVPRDARYWFRFSDSQLVRITGNASQVR